MYKKIVKYMIILSDINIKTFSTTKDLFKLNKKDVFIILDKNTFDYYSDNKLDNYTGRYEDFISNEYTFKVRTNSALYRLLDKYIGVMDENKLVIEGLNNHYDTIKSGNIITKIAEYILLILLLVVLIIFIIFKKSKRISIARKIKKDDKMKFIDKLFNLAFSFAKFNASSEMSEQVTLINGFSSFIARAIAPVPVHISNILSFGFMNPLTMSINSSVQNLGIKALSSVFIIISLKCFLPMI